MKEESLLMEGNLKGPFKLHWVMPCWVQVEGRGWESVVGRRGRRQHTMSASVAVEIQAFGRGGRDH